jgi:hypothetical protein
MSMPGKSCLQQHISSHFLPRRWRQTKQHGMGSKRYVTVDSYREAVLLAVDGWLHGPGGGRDGRLLANESPLYYMVRRVF